MADESIEIATDNPSDSWEGDTYSLTSSVMEFTFENGRRYHGYKEGQYFLPNDEKQNDVMDLLHEVFLMRQGRKLFLAPIEPKTVIDIGTGTGIWAIDVADEFPKAEVQGTDLSPTQPELIPENLQFYVDDAEDEWIAPPNYFDLVHMRMLFVGINDWPRLIGQAYNHTAPGGWTEIVEIELPYKSDDGTLREDGKIMKWISLCYEASKTFGKDIYVAPKMKSWMEEAGFINVQDIPKKIPIGPWPKKRHLRDIGACNLRHLLDGLEGYTIAALTRGLGWKADEVTVFLAGVRNELLDPSIHGYFLVHNIIGQKPPVEQASPQEGAKMPMAPMEQNKPPVSVPEKGK